MDYLQGFLWNASWSVATHICVSALLSENMFLSLLSLPQSLTIWMANYRVKNSRLAAPVCGVCTHARVCVCICACCLLCISAECCRTQNVHSLPPSLCSLHLLFVQNICGLSLSRGMITLSPSTGSWWTGVVCVELRICKLHL